jgi:acyl-CoA oxidase
LLNRLSDVDENGQFVSAIKSADARFALSLGGLSSGRLLVASDNTDKFMESIKFALRFAVMRQAFGDLKNETRLIEYPLQQYRLFPLLAQAFSLRNCNIFLLD